MSTDQLFIDNLMYIFTLILYLFLMIIYILRAHEFSDWELRLAVPFSLQMIPFGILWIINLINLADFPRLFTSSFILIFFGFDLYYRLLSRKKPIHHPDTWPKSLIVYLVLMYFGLFMLNWYSFLVSKDYGTVTIISFFIMLGTFGYYQAKYKKRKKKESIKV